MVLFFVRMGWEVVDDTEATPIEKVLAMIRMADPSNPCDVQLMA